MSNDHAETVMAERDDFDDFEPNDCWQCGGEGYVYGCSWDWQCDTYDPGEMTCLCFRRCDVCNHSAAPQPEISHE